MIDETWKIPQATTRRLPLYYRFLQNFANANKTRISSSELSEAMKIDAATIRRDFSHFGALGRKGYGYDVQYLLDFFRKTLDQDEVTDVALIGVGSLGTAFLKYNFHKNHNTRIVIAFDPRTPKEGMINSGIPVYHSDQMTEKIKEQGIELAILTVPADVAQYVTNDLVDVGIKGILNFSPVRLSAPDSVRVHTIDLSVELQTLVYFMKNDVKQSQL
ncbi:redox-sensing transcriptional repressor Rex [Sporosarcina pasteurii]|uniref:Redox-sensing transcriptional repressor Rex n=1 Tax=Sporosarcina pasteurii TaxID=1474 RepID=A0A380CHF4_SPOPA|nr:redox-sensing transcriptional repressor Rex [Sporosarcina pasteurii]MDS9473171.1 redox-sensing transcriptional repressor Rex [Sporosarcina pasteurii]QBQ06906.1 redox-sensing transcriptional repressor Rex [Sporosarcina pasteurii]SUJ19672.1 Redox-sensing transcriptional repressor rex [Sporosarcina pasteurii]